MRVIALPYLTFLFVFQGSTDPCFFNGFSQLFNSLCIFEKFVVFILLEFAKRDETKLIILGNHFVWFFKTCDESFYSNFDEVFLYFMRLSGNAFG